MPAEKMPQDEQRLESRLVLGDRVGDVIEDKEHRMRYLDMDVNNVQQQDAILRLCQTNKSQYSDVWMHLRKSCPPGLPKYLVESVEQGMDEFIQTAAPWDLHGIVAVDGDKTDDNPEGKDKVVGFMLYNIHETKQELEMLFLLVDTAYRHKQHGSNMVKACISLHLFNVDNLSQPKETTTPARDLVQFITVRLERKDPVLTLYTKLGFHKEQGGDVDRYTTMVLGHQKSFLQALVASKGP